jgi:hypothetical protein
MPLCQRGTELTERELHRQMLLVFSRVDQNQRRWFVALESERLGHSNDRLLSQITGLDEKTIRRERKELTASPVDNSPEHIRRPGSDRPPVEREPVIISSVQAARPVCNSQ